MEPKLLSKYKLMLICNYLISSDSTVQNKPFPNRRIQFVLLYRSINKISLEGPAKTYLFIDFPSRWPISWTKPNSATHELLHVNIVGVSAP